MKFGLSCNRSGVSSDKLGLNCGRFGLPSYLRLLHVELVADPSEHTGGQSASQRGIQLTRLYSLIFPVLRTSKKYKTGYRPVVVKVKSGQIGLSCDRFGLSCDRFR